LLSSEPQRNPPSWTWSPSTSLPGRPSVSKSCTCFWVLAHDRRRIVHCNVTAHPTAEWTGSNCGTPFPSTNCRATCCATAMPSSARTSETGARHGHPRSSVHAALTLAASPRGAGDWFHSAGVLGPCDRVP
jgi:hypothetical protein